MEQLDLLIVDDEPSAQRYVASLVDKHCPGFRVSATAENGAEALELVRRCQPDMVITDIRMPLMDGLELAGMVKAEFPGLSLVITSGYQDFEYARSALQHGVLDYLLKPVNGQELASLLASLYTKLCAGRYWQRSFLLRQILSGMEVDPVRQRRFLSFPRYFLAALRLGGLPARFTPPRGDPLAERCLTSGKLVPGNVWVVPGRDDQEVLFVVAPELAEGEAWTALVRQTVDSLADEWHTLLFDNASHGLDGLRAAAKTLSASLDRMVVFGQSRVRSGLPQETEADPPPSLDAMAARQLEFLASEGRFAELRQETDRLLGHWTASGLPQIKLETCLKQLVLQVVDAAGRGADMAPGVPERLVEDTLATARHLADLSDGCWSIIEDLVQIPPNAPGNADVPQFFAGIKTWLSRNLEQQLTLPGVCEHFGISQSWLSKLFRRFEGMSFGDWLTMLRVDAAKRLLADTPDMPLKQVAACVGFRDQFYFSRVFKAVTGQPPSEYLSGSITKRPREG